MRFTCEKFRMQTLISQKYGEFIEKQYRKKNLGAYCLLETHRASSSWIFYPCLASREEKEAISETRKNVLEEGTWVKLQGREML